MRVDLQDFEDRYRATADPWGFVSSPYELHKYACTVAHLRGRRYRRGFEPGCSIGVLTELLAPHVDRLIACDPSPTATAAARARTAGLAQVEIVTAAVPDWWPGGTFDLVVVSELGYYWDEAGLGSLLQRTLASLAAGGVLLAVHWLGISPDHLLTGHQVHTLIRSAAGEPDATFVHRPPTRTDAPAGGFVLERWSRRP